MWINLSILFNRRYIISKLILEEISKGRGREAKKERKKSGWRGGVEERNRHDLEKRGLTDWLLESQFKCNHMRGKLGNHDMTIPFRNLTINGLWTECAALQHNKTRINRLFLSDEHCIMFRCGGGGDQNDFHQKLMEIMFMMTKLITMGYMRRGGEECSRMKNNKNMQRWGWIFGS